MSPLEDFLWQTQLNGFTIIQVIYNNSIRPTLLTQLKKLGQLSHNSLERWGQEPPRKQISPLIWGWRVRGWLTGLKNEDTLPPFYSLYKMAFGFIFPINARKGEITPSKCTLAWEPSISFQCSAYLHSKPITREELCILETVWSISS